jgi:hypothetical protein
MAEYRLRQHIMLGGRPDDRIGRELLWKFATKIWTDPSVAPLLRQHGVTTPELGAMLQAVIESLMPEPWMNVGVGLMFPPTAWFMEPHLIENLLVQTTRDAAGLGREEWLRQLIDSACLAARATKEGHDERFGPPKARIVQAGGLRSAGGGCAGAVLLVTAAVALATFAILC